MQNDFLQRVREGEGDEFNDGKSFDPPVVYWFPSKVLTRIADQHYLGDETRDFEEGERAVYGAEGG